MTGTPGMYSMFCNVSLDTFLGVFDISALICKGCKESKIISPALELGSEIYTLELQKNFNQKLLKMSILSKLFLLLVCVLKSIPSLILKSNLSLIPKIWHIWFQLNSWYEDRICNMYLKGLASVLGKFSIQCCLLHS